MQNLDIYLYQSCKGEFEQVTRAARIGKFPDNSARKLDSIEQTIEKIMRSGPHDLSITDITGTNAMINLHSCLLKHVDSEVLKTLVSIGSSAHSTVKLPVPIRQETLDIFRKFFYNLMPIHISPDELVEIRWIAQFFLIDKLRLHVEHRILHGLTSGTFSTNVVQDLRKSILFDCIPEIKLLLHV